MIQARKHPPSDLTAGLYTKLLARGQLWAEVFQFDAVASKYSLVVYGFKLAGCGQNAVITCLHSTLLMCYGIVAAVCDIVER